MDGTSPELDQLFFTIDRSAGPEACWPWTGGTFNTGYGQAFFRGRPTTAHRAVWIVLYGDPGRHKVLHKCPGGSMRLCCNPAHLKPGTDKENADDRAREGRTYRGTQVHCHKLTEDDVRSIRLAHQQGTSVYRLAKDRGMSQATIRSCVLRKTWKHVV